MKDSKWRCFVGVFNEEAPEITQELVMLRGVHPQYPKRWFIPMEYQQPSEKSPEETAVALLKKWLSLEVAPEDLRKMKATNEGGRLVTHHFRVLVDAIGLDWMTSPDGVDWRLIDPTTLERRVDLSNRTRKLLQYYVRL
jgi:hypothetical protein